MRWHVSLRQAAMTGALASAFFIGGAPSSVQAAASRRPPVLSGAAAIHDLARYGGRYCFADHVHFGSSENQPSLAKAKAEAIDSWFQLVDLEYGAQWSSFATAAKKSVQCAPSGTSWGCEIHAIPCSR